ncbi:vitamin B12 transporter [Chitinophaga skermanii]|uniref:Vitamin B12 transporter n=1 Tax=Chitinophaga skermanii TaxID=331697 RepID=A0A327R441_9BACT|nr:TonB-dependent receptor [Chitinophaga skermanii]RAJ10544.1 vitamin B12 transporter [Chitinophaga skermanii]
MYKKSTLFGVALLLIGTTTFAQRKSVGFDTTNNQLNTVVVTATRFPKKLGETGKVVTVITQEDLQRNNGKTLTQILNNQSGVIVNGAENALGTLQEVYTRGASSGNTLILLDGIPMYDASTITNTFDLNFISLANIERIEILKGSQSTLYGSDATAGVINIITKKNYTQPIGVNGSASYGSYGTFNGNATVNGTVKKLSYQVGYNYLGSEGFSSAYDSTGKGNFDKDGFTRNQVFANIGYAINPRWQINAFANYARYSAGLDAGAFSDQTGNKVNNNTLLAGVNSKYSFKSGSWNLIYSYQQNKRHQIKDSVIANDYYFYADYISNTHQIETYVNLDLTQNIQFIVGADYRTSNTDEQYRSAFPVKGISPDSAHMNQFSHYASLLLHNLNGFSLEVGGRFNYHNVYGNNQTISFNPSYLINDKHKVFINISSAYKTPTLYQLYSEYGNKDLKPETSLNYEFGYQAAVAQNAVNFRVTGFYRQVENWIDFYSAPWPDPSFYYNADKQEMYGAEIEGSWNITRDLRLTANYTYVKGKTIDQDTSYNNLYRRPEHALNASLGYQATKKLYVSLQSKVIGKRWEKMYQAPSQPLASYYTLDAYADYQINKHLKVYADFRNFTNQQYFDIRGYNSRKANFTAGVLFNF